MGVTGPTGPTGAAGVAAVSEPAAPGGVPFVQPFSGTFDIESCPVPPTPTTEGGDVAGAGGERGDEVTPNFTG